MAGPCSALDVLDQLWPELEVFVKTSQDTRLFFMVRHSNSAGWIFGRPVGRPFRYVFRRHLQTSRRVKAGRSSQSIGEHSVGLLYGKTPAGSSDPFVEHTPIIEITPRFYLPRQLLLTDRNRYDFRFVNGVYTPRYRNRLKIERTFQTGKRAITPYANVEAFYDRRYDSFHRSRYTIGGEFEINKRYVLEGHYLRQQDSQTEPRGLNVAGIALQIYFH